MTPQQFAALIDGRQYRNEITAEEEAIARAAGLVVMLGYSDDNVEIYGAIREEVGAIDGATITFSRDGSLLPSWEWQIDNDCSEGAIADWIASKAAGTRTVEAKWCVLPTEPAWTFETDIPHATFTVKEEGEPDFCRGIVFALADLGPATPTVEQLTEQLDAATTEVDRLLSELRVMTQQIRDLEAALADQSNH